MSFSPPIKISGSLHWYLPQNSGDFRESSLHVRPLHPLFQTRSSFTIDTYAHVLPALARIAADKTDAVFG
jgi:hypothetical protein